MSIEVKNLKKVNDNLDKIADRLGIDVLIVQKKVAFDVFSDIVAATPIDTGRAMNNWNISANTPNHDVTDEGGNSSGIKTAKEAGAGAAMLGLKPFSTVWISNSLPYIVFLNEGSSDQAPKQFVEQSVINNLASLSVAL